MDKCVKYTERIIFLPYKGRKFSNLIHSMTWMDIEDIMPSEINWLQETSTVNCKDRSNLQRQKAWNGVASGWEGKRISSTSSIGVEFQFGKMSKFWRSLVVMVAQQCECR